jgi:hypothetical protein
MAALIAVTRTNEADSELTWAMAPMALGAMNPEV